MTATTSAKAAQTAKNPVQIGKPKEEANSKGFANLLADSITKGNPGKKAAKVQANPLLDLPQASDASPKLAKKSVEHLREHAKGKAPHALDGVDLSVLGEVAPEEMEGKTNNLKLGDILAELSHESSAPVGSEVINLKTVLSSKNDDPDLINKDLLALVEKKDRHKVMASLIGGAKQLLTEQLESRIPKNRVPKTLKGLLETAIRFNLVVSDIKLESLPENKVTQTLLEAINMKEKKGMPLPTLSAKAAVDALVPHATAKATVNEVDPALVNSSKKLHKKSPLEQMLNPKDKSVVKDAAVSKDIALAKELALQEKQAPKEQVLTKALESAHVPTKTATSVSTAKEKDRNKVESKHSAKIESKEALARETAKTTPLALNENKQAHAKGSSLEKLLAVDTQESTTQENKGSQESTHTQNVSSKQDSPLAKAEAGMNVKMAEARQLVSQLSADVKEAMESYKPPFTKLSMKLNPERLGDIDVVMVQRGNNVHINLTSNGTALGMLQQNSADLKVALNNAGLGDATMNFSSNGEDRNQQQQQQKHSTSEHYAEMSKLLEDIDNLEIVVPRYV